MTLQDHMIKRFSNIIGRSPERLVTTLPCLAIGYCGSGDVMILVCQVISYDHVTKGLSNIRGHP